MGRNTVVASLMAMSFLAGGSAQATSIGAFFASDGSDCDLTVGAFLPFNTYIGVVLGGDAATGGIAGAEFRVDGIDATWFNAISFNPALNLARGNPIEGGCQVTFPTCNSGSGHFVLLYTIQSIATLNPSPHIFTVRRHTTPSSSAFACPFVWLCEEGYPMLCVDGGEAFLNRSTPCTVDVEVTTWGRVRYLFR